ncbi:BglG family transcription antiterminator [Dielma fastidiosa]|uniref:BglG family transcription antiterminator n=1 Tax=Dielma fastidiosa TaxID=1034346 RepID=UPI0035676A55
MAAKLDLLRLLESNSECLSLKEIAEQLNTNEKSIRTLIRNTRLILPTDIAEIKSRVGSGNGFYLEIYNHIRFAELLTSGFDVDENLIRRITIISQLTAKEYVKADNLAEEFFISKGQLTKDLNKIRQMAEPFNLTIQSVPHYGLKLVGSETDKRVFFARSIQSVSHFSWECVSVLRPILPKEIVCQVESELLSFLAAHDEITINSDAIHSLVLHITIMILGIRSQKNKSINQNYQPKQPQIDELADRLADRFNVTLSSDDWIYLYSHVMGKRYIADSNPVIPNDIYELATRMIERVKKNCGIDLQCDFDLHMHLAMHLVPLIIRLHFHVNMMNPLREEIKTKYILAYDLSLEACREIEQMINAHLSEDEISYIALYFEMALDKTQTINRKRVLIVCEARKVSSMLLKQQIIENFGIYIEAIDVCTLKQLKFIQLERYHYLFSTVPLADKLPIPIINIQHFLNQDELAQIGNKLADADWQHYFKPELFMIKESSGTKVELINEMTAHIQKIYDLPQNFSQLVLEREGLSSTDYGGMLALPHPAIPLHNETFVCVCVLKKPMIWSKEMVRLVFLINVRAKEGSKMQPFYKMLTYLAGKQSIINQLAEVKNYDDFMNILISIRGK